MPHDANACSRGGMRLGMRDPGLVSTVHDTRPTATLTLPCICKQQDKLGLRLTHSQQRWVAFSTNDWYACRRKTVSEVKDLRDVCFRCLLGRMLILRGAASLPGRHLIGKGIRLV